LDNDEQLLVSINTHFITINPTKSAFKVRTILTCKIISSLFHQLWDS